MVVYERVHGVNLDFHVEMCVLGVVRDRATAVHSLAFCCVGCRGQASCLMERYPRVRVIVDVFELTSMKFLNQRFFDWKLPPVLWPPYTSGAVFCSSMLDTVLCQVRIVLRNVSLINVLERRAFVFGEWEGVEARV